MWDDHWQENLFWEAKQKRNSKSAEWKQVVPIEKNKMKIIRKKKVKLGKRREGQNIWIEINYSMKCSDLICINLKDKKWMLQSYAEKKILQIMEKTTVDFIFVSSSIYHCFLLL